MRIRGHRRSMYRASLAARTGGGSSDVTRGGRGGRGDVHVPPPPPQAEAATATATIAAASLHGVPITSPRSRLALLLSPDGLGGNPRPSETADLGGPLRERDEPLGLCPDGVAVVEPFQPAPRNAGVTVAGPHQGPGHRGVGVGVSAQRD